MAANNKAAAIHMWSKIGEVNRVKGDANAAIRAGEKARSIDPHNFEALAFLALAYDSAGRQQDARRVYDEALQVDPNNLVMLNNYAYLLAQSGGNLDQALSFAQRAMQSRPGIPEVMDTVGWIYLKKQLPDNALEMFQKIVSERPNNPTYRLHLAMALDQKGDRNGAKKQLQLALQNNPRPEDKDAIERMLKR